MNKNKLNTGIPPKREHDGMIIGIFASPVKKTFASFLKSLRKTGRTIENEHKDNKYSKELGIKCQINAPI